MKRFKWYILTLVLCILSGCMSSGKAPNEPPKINITIDGQSVDYMVGKNQWAGCIISRKDNFVNIMKKDSGFEVGYFEPGKTAFVKFSGKMPDGIRIFDYVLKENGESMYNDEEKIAFLQYETVKDTLSFVLEENPAAPSGDELSKKTIKGIKILCFWNDDGHRDECEYDFIIRTDVKPDNN